MRRLLLVVLLSGLVACGSDAPSDYSDESRSNVLVACSGDRDRPIVGDVCACTYRSIRTHLPYDRFAEIDDQLRNRPDQPLPDDVLDLMAECIVEVGAL